MTVGGDVITGIIGSIIYDGLKRPFKGMAEMAARRKVVNRALVAGPTLDKSEISDSNRSISDLARILGNDHNAYSEDIANFLREVERSAIPDALKHFALCGHKADDAYPAFEIIYNSYQSLPFSCRSLFDALNAAIVTRLEQSIEDKVLFEALKAQNEDLAARITALSACLRNAGDLGPPLSSGTYNEIRQRAARGIETSNRQVNVETTQGTRKVNIKKLVIAARLIQVSDRGEIPAPHREAQSERTTTISYLAFRRTFNRSVILGDPGGGKSTLTQLLCHDLAHQISLAAANPNYAAFDSRDIRLPLRLVLRTLEKRQQQNPSYQIFDYIVDEIRLHCDNDVSVATRFLQQSLVLGQAVLLFDGLDEILDVGARRNMAVLIEQFTSEYACCPALVTSRIVGYNDAPLNEDFQILTLSRFNDDEVKKFTEQLIRAITSEKKDSAKTSSINFLSQTENTAKDLRENPLLLGLMVYIFSARGEVPNNRPEIYKECSILMFEKWDQRRDIRFDFPQDFDLLDLFSFLAKQIFGNAETEDGVDEGWLTKALRDYFNTWYQDKARSVSAAKVLVDFITGRAWVMCEIGPGVFKFTHRTFLEYFFAKRIEEEAGSVKGLIYGHLQSKISNAQWDVVGHLSLQIATFRSGPKSVQAADTLLEIASNSQLPPNEEINFLSFFARSLDYLLIPEAKLADVVEHIFNRCIYLGHSFSLMSGEVLHDVLSSTRRRESVVIERLHKIASPILDGESGPRRSYLLYAVGTKYSGYQLHRRSTSPTRSVWNAFQSIRNRHQAAQFERAKNDIKEARNYIFVYGDNIKYLYDLHGISLIFVPYSPLIPFDICHLPYILTHEAVRLNSLVAGPTISLLELSRKEAGELLIDISDKLLAAWSEKRIGEIVPDVPGDIRFGFLEEIFYYLGVASTRGRPSIVPLLTQRALFVYSVLAGDGRRTDVFENVALFRGRLRRENTKDLASRIGLGDDPFSDAVRQLARRRGDIRG